jgi:hypothetical protein
MGETGELLPHYLHHGRRGKSENLWVMLMEYMNTNFRVPGKEVKEFLCSTSTLEFSPPYLLTL